MFSTLYTKTHRANQVILAANRFRHVVITETDVIMKPFALIMIANTIVLLCWTLLSPKQHKETPLCGTDHWNHTFKSYYGACHATHSTYYLAALAIINGGVVIIANVEAYQARNLQTGYSESKYITVAMGSLLQVLIVVTPILVLIDEHPQAKYPISVTSTFIVVVMVTLLLVFIPNFIVMRKKLHETYPSASSGSGGLKLQVFKLGAYTYPSTRANSSCPQGTSSTWECNDGANQSAAFQTKNSSGELQMNMATHKLRSQTGNNKSLDGTGQ